jgi:anti-anti-sigma regulatory factor
MLSIHIDNVGDVAIIECKGRIVRSEAALKLREAVNSQLGARVIVLDLSEVAALEAGGLGMLGFLQRWAKDHGMQLKLFNPRESVRCRLEQVSWMREFNIIARDDLVDLLAVDESRNAVAA